MTCSKAQSLITPYINDELNIKESEEFIHHIFSCPECKEELEVYYALLTAMKQLDEDKILSDDFNMELSAKLEHTQEKIIHVKYTYYRKKAALLFIIILLAFFISFRYAYIRQEREAMPTESDFQLRMTFKEERNPVIESILIDYLKNLEEISQ